MASLILSTSERDAASNAEAAKQLVFIDPTVDDYQSLLAGLAPDTAVYLLDSDEDGLAQIAAAAQHYSGLASISLVAHGADGAIELGSGIVNSDALAHSTTALQTIGGSLAPGGELLLDSCDTGQGPMGQDFVDALAQATGANVGAASHLVGDVAAGDGWNLDVSSTGGALPAPQVLSAAAEDSFAAPLAINDPASGLPINITSFTGDTSFYETGTAISTTSSGYLQLTNNTGNQSGIAVYKNAFQSTAGITVQFTYYSGGGSGADGISFFLLDASAITAAGGSASTVKAGGYGGGLGYSDDGQAGITNGWLGLGFDTYGNYSGTDRGQSGNSGTLANEVGVRGSGNGTSGYALLNNVAYAPGIDGTRTVKINLVKVDSTHESLSVFMSTDGGNTFTEVITNESINQTLPNNFYLGFAASSGGSTDTHQIENLSVTLPVTLAVSAPVITYPNTTDSSKYQLLPGDKFSYTYTIKDTGPNGSSEITLQDALPSSVVNASSVTWSVKDDVQTQTGTGAINLSNINLSSGDQATVTISGTISSSAASGNADHTLTATPGPDFSSQGSSSGVVAMAIGSPNPYLTGTTPTASTHGTTAIAPFSAAQVADPHNNPTFTGTITLKNSGGATTDANGTLSGTGLTETSTKGVYTLTASGASAFNADLESLVFTPTSANSSVNTTVAISVSDGVSGTTPATASTVINTTCFLAGTHVLTEQGEVLVEELLARHLARSDDDARDRVATMVDGAVAYKEVVWVGGREVEGRGLPPVRVRRDAIAPGVPHRDLLVTPEHCLFLDGCLIPARMLVNGRSVTEEHGMDSYRYYHVELEKHGILIAEGLTTESYLDTGNRGNFANAEIVTLRPGVVGDMEARSWTLDACAPLATARDAVEPIWCRIDVRADELGFAARATVVSLDADPDLRLLLEDGHAIRPLWRNGKRHLFQMRNGQKAVRLLSRFAAPAEVIGPFVDDRRQLGVQVEALTLWQGREDVPLAAVELGGDGWHGLEGSVRWTNGSAALALPPVCTDDSFVEVVVASTFAYPTRPPAGVHQAAA